MTPTEHGVGNFYYYEKYTLVQKSQNKYQLHQKIDGEFWDVISMFEFSNVDGRWLITDWSGTIESK